MDQSPEAAYWLSLAYASGLKLARVKAIVNPWCIEGGQSLSALFELSPVDMPIRIGVSDEEVEQVVAAASRVPEQAKWLARLEADGTQLITRGDPRYPRALVRWLPLVLEPLLLFCQGNTRLLNHPSVSVIGTQDADGKGISLARELTTLLAEEGLVVVSGLGKGVGQAAFEAALSVEEGQASAVLPMGISAFHGITDASLALDAAANQDRVLLISPFHPEAKFSEARAVARYKLIVSLTEAIFVVTAGEAGIAREAADEALRLGKTVCVWDIEPTVGPEVAGNQALVKAGAIPIACIQDILDAVEAVMATALERIEKVEHPPIPSPSPVTQVMETEAPYDSQAVLDLLSSTGHVPDVLAKRLRAGEEDLP